MLSYLKFMMNKLYCLNVIVLTARNNMTIPYGKFSKKGLAYFTLNAISLLPKIDNIHFIAKQLNASIIAISESKLDSFILNSEVDIRDMIQSEWIIQNEEAELILKNHFLIFISQVFFLTLNALLWTLFCPNQSQFWYACYNGEESKRM